MKLLGIDVPIQLRHLLAVFFMLLVIRPQHGLSWGEIAGCLIVFVYTVGLLTLFVNVWKTFKKEANTPPPESSLDHTDGR